MNGIQIVGDDKDDLHSRLASYGISPELYDSIVIAIVEAEKESRKTTKRLLTALAIEIPEEYKAPKEPSDFIQRKMKQKLKKWQR
jgi:hypothetical protein